MAWTDALSNTLVKLMFSFPSVTVDRERLRDQVTLAGLGIDVEVRQDRGTLERDVEPAYSRRAEEQFGEVETHDVRPVLDGRGVAERPARSFTTSRSSVVFQIGWVSSLVGRP